LDELRRRESYELLRRPLRQYGLFPSTKDPRSASITTEELKKLVRHWKLHEVRGFWRAHHGLDDLAEVLLNYMAD
ncbi:unnamed protein product, partial [Discosporangium mesarthrocarpum]